MHDLMINELKNVLIAFICTWGLQLLTGITVRNPLTILFFAFFWGLGSCSEGEKSMVKRAITAAISLALSGLITFL